MKKVYIVTQMTAQGQMNTMVATKNQEMAARLLHVSPHYLRSFGNITGNTEDRAVALRAPGVVFVRHIDNHNAAAWEEWQP